MRAEPATLTPTLSQGEREKTTCYLLALSAGKALPYIREGSGKNRTTKVAESTKWVSGVFLPANLREWERRPSFSLLRRVANR